MIRKNSSFFIHANAASYGESGIIVVGDSRAGKTSLTLALLRGGWRFVGDDALAIEKIDDHVRASALRRGISCTPTSISKFSDILGGLPTQSLDSNKSLVYWEDSNTSTISCIPTVMVFPCITDASESKIETLDKSSTMMRLLKHSPGFKWDRPRSKEQLDTLRELVVTTDSYTLKLGRDLHTSSSNVCDLLEQAVRQYTK